MSADVRSDEELMHAYLAGEKNAIAILLTRRRDWMWSVARKTVRDVAIAEDAVQEVFIAIWKSAGRFDPVLKDCSSTLLTSVCTTV